MYIETVSQSKSVFLLFLFSYYETNQYEYTLASQLLIFVTLLTVWDPTDGLSFLTWYLCRQSKILSLEIGVWHPGQCYPWDGDLVCTYCWINAWSCFVTGLKDVFPIITCAQPCSYKCLFKPEHPNYAVDLQMWWLCLLRPLLSGLGLRSTAENCHDSFPILLHLPGCSNRCGLCFCYCSLFLEYQYGFQDPVFSVIFSCASAHMKPSSGPSFTLPAPRNCLYPRPPSQLHSKALPPAGLHPSF